MGFARELSASDIKVNVQMGGIVTPGGINNSAAENLVVLIP